MVLIQSDITLHQQLLNIVGQLNKHWITPIGIGAQE